MRVQQGASGFLRAVALEPGDGAEWLDLLGPSVVEGLSAAVY
ncbi:hypothetical protein [Curtobacterium sp. MCSS17_005]|nr:hypothetical protein [Curtobacterium sp. MCSS17_005]WIB34390.1 hypothetical protein DEJ20_07965 [Curtobacterium sp. MCSS17_005]